MKILKSGYFFILFAGFLIVLGGCATLTESTKCVVGVSTKVLEDNRKSAIRKDFNYSYFESFTKTLDSLKEQNTYIYVQDIKKRLIAIYVSETDTTPVGIFFKESGPETTQLEVSSPSTYAKELIAKKVFESLEKAPNP